ncbi:sigma-70 family RNA polymerase sigma factor [Occultella glacieicola]|uniref:Sigma-70 family RNA polymerase sigma factor n=1 Tax=Occultella glacieicola TaxID=2518684 RepID=A0ABY2E9M8_9MICO|nr:sigma-70 family RNA polymerase sigma factor [Occultella glacieicola]TDE99091.1 sigma-70 family RNA polymerase sigma factor [Occultella glacieicola]
MIEASPGETLVVRASAAFERFRGGDRAAFDDLVGMLTPLLWHTSRGQGLDRTEAEDVLQTVWLSLVRSAASVRDPRTVVKWLLVTTKRESWRVSRARGNELAHTSTPRADAETDELDRVAVPAEDLPEHVAVRNERDLRLWHHVRELSDRCRELLRVIAFADRPDYAAIAEALGMPVGSIGPTRGRCLARLRAKLSTDPGWVS